MCAVENTELLLVWGKDFSRTPKDASFQLYDIEEDEWYEPFTFTNDKFKDAVMLGVIENHLYFSGGQDEIDETEKSYEAYYSFDFLTKEVMNIGVLEAMACSWKDNYIIKEECIYKIAENVSRFNTIDNSVKKDCGKFEDNFYGFAVRHNGYIYGLQPYSMIFIVAELIIYNIDTGDVKFEKIPEYVDGFHSLVVVGDKIYMVSINHLRHMIIYTPETKDWEIFPVKGPSKIMDGRAILCNGRLLCVEERCFVYEYDFGKKRWDFLSRDYSGPLCLFSRMQTVKKSFMANW